MDSAKNQLVEKIHSANNILVTVSRDPSVDQLAACIGLTLLLNKLDKHATAVFSGQIPSTMEFLQPDQTLEKNTDSLRDFIIALDKSKADKLRYKVEDEMVRIFITPYRTSISQADLEFSQGDFNVDLVIALGVHQQEDLDQAIVTHGRILHDATVTTINTDDNSDLGAINWTDPQASSLAELITDLARQLGANMLDGQIATALLTGIVAETARFSNDKTTPQTMSASAELMAAGANQQLVASKLDEPHNDNPSDGGSASGPSGDQPKNPDDHDGELDIEHESDDEEPNKPEEPAPSAEEQPKDDGHQTGQVDEAVLIADDEPELPQVTDLKVVPSVPSLEEQTVPQPDKPEPVTVESNEGEVVPKTPHVLTEPPILVAANDTGLAGAYDEVLEGVPDPLSATSNNLPQLLSHDADPTSTESPAEPVADQIPNEELSLPAVEPEVPIADIPEPVILSEPTVAPTPVPEHKAPEPILVGFTPPPPAWVPPSDDAFDIIKNQTPHDNSEQTLSDIEQSVNSPHVDAPAQAHQDQIDTVDNARDEVERALVASQSTPQPIEALNAQPMVDALHPNNQTGDIQPLPGVPAPLPEHQPIVPGASFEETLPVPQPLPVASNLGGVLPMEASVSAPQVFDPTAPPPVPPPLFPTNLPPQPS